MKLNDEQIFWIKGKVSHAVKYQETYHEVLDHLVSAINNNTDDVSYNDQLIDNIIDQDFGGYQTLKLTEKERAKDMNYALRNKHWHNMLQFFNVPVVCFTLLSIIGTYYIAVNPHARRVLIVISMAGSVAPLLFLFYKRISAKYKQRPFGNYHKPSLKDNYIFIAAILANSLFNLANAANKEITANVGITVFVFVFYLVYVFSFFKLYRDEFKMNIAR